MSNDPLAVRPDNESRPRLFILAQSGTHNRLHALVSLVATAVSVGGEAHVLLTHAALKAHLTGSLDDAPVQTGDPEYDQFYTDALEHERLPSLRGLLEQARARGGVMLYACQQSVQLWRRYTPEQLGQVDAIIGHATFLQLVRGGPLVFI